MQAGTYFLERRRMLFFGVPLILTLFWPASTLLRGHHALATLFLFVNDPQISEHWATLMKCTWANIYISEQDFRLEFQCDAQWTFLNFTRWIGFRMSVHFLRMEFGGVMS